MKGESAGNEAFKNQGTDAGYFGWGFHAVGVRAQQRRNLRDNTRYDRKVAKLTQLRPNGFGN